MFLIGDFPTVFISLQALLFAFSSYVNKKRGTMDLFVAVITCCISTLWPKTGLFSRPFSFAIMS